MLRSEDSEWVRKEKTMRPYKFAMINGKKIRFVADTGADTSTTQLRTVETLRLREMMMKSEKVLKAIGNITIQVVGRLKTILEMGGENYPVDFLVKEDDLEVLER